MQTGGFRSEFHLFRRSAALVVCTRWEIAGAPEVFPHMTAVMSFMAISSKRETPTAASRRLAAACLADRLFAGPHVGAALDSCRVAAGAFLESRNQKSKQGTCRLRPFSS